MIFGFKAGWAPVLVISTEKNLRVFGSSSVSFVANASNYAADPANALSSGTVREICSAIAEASIAIDVMRC